MKLFTFSIFAHLNRLKCCSVYLCTLSHFWEHIQ